jgi:uncharacterized protein
VSTPHHPLRFNVGFLINQPVGSSREFYFEYSKIHLQPDLDLNQLSGEARVSRTPQGMLVQAQFFGRACAECVRCLNAYEQELITEFSELFAFKPSGMTDAALLYPEDGNLDLEPLVREYLLLEFPIRSLCRPDCRGLCVECGADLNTGDCGHSRELNSEIAGNVISGSR